VALQRARAEGLLAVAVEAADRMTNEGRSIPDVAGSLGVSSQSLRNWKRQDDRDRGERDDGLTSAEREELRELRKRVKRLAQERDILKRATALFARETEIR
jgi:transposase